MGSLQDSLLTQEQLNQMGFQATGPNSGQSATPSLSQPGVTVFTRCPLPILSTSTPDNLRTFYQNNVVPQTRLLNSTTPTVNSGSATQNVTNVTQQNITKTITNTLTVGGTFADPGNLTFPGSTFMFQWGTTPTFDTGPTTITFSPPFSHACLGVLLTDTLSTGASRIWSVTSFSASSFVAHNDGNGSAIWFAWGY